MNAAAARHHRARLNSVRVLLADRDRRTSQLVKAMLNTFGFRLVDIANNGDEALRLLRDNAYDFIITEWYMVPVNGPMLVRTIRTAKRESRIRRDLPILMLTARSEIENVQEARDIGISEFVVKPFSAKTLSNRIIRLIDQPRSFVEASSYVGPCRRRHEGAPEGMADRRLPADKKLLQPLARQATITPPNRDLAAKIGLAAAEILDEVVIAEAQLELMGAESEFLDWVKDDIGRLKKSHAQLKLTPEDFAARSGLQDAAYSVKSLAGIFGYNLGTDIAKLLVDYLDVRTESSESDLLIIAKHIDAIDVIFRKNIKENGLEIGENLVAALKKLAEKLS